VGCLLIIKNIRYNKQKYKIKTWENKILKDKKVIMSDQVKEPKNDKSYSGDNRVILI